MIIETLQLFANGTFVADFDDATYYTEFWNGFSNDEAYLSIYCGDYSGTNSAQIFITSIDGDSLSDLKLRDSDAPVLKVDIKEYDETNLPIGIVNIPYPIYSSSALDSYDGQTSVNISVFYNYLSSNRCMYDIKDDCFIPDRSGIYTIIYSTIDRSGNKCEKRFNVNVADTFADIIIVLDDNCQTS